jgi:4-amino-4-deoxy-L-arabinose transferase-like glycosyltransferase
MSLYAIFVLGFNLNRILFGWFIYLFGYSILLLPFYIQKYSLPQKFYKFIAIIGIIISIGLIIDSFFPIFSFFKLSQDADLFVESKGELNRATFFAESPTVLAVAYTFCLLCTIYCFYYIRKKGAKIFFLLSILLYIGGALSSGSRQIIGIVLIMIICSFIYLSFKQKSNKIGFFILSVIISFLSIYFANKYIERKQDEVFMNRYKLESLQEDERQQFWKEGFSQLTFHNFFSYPIGHGVTYTMGQKAKFNELIHHHFESTIWSTFYEGGLISWFLIFSPFIYALKQLLKRPKCFFRFLLLMFFINYIIICFVAPGGLHPTALMSMFIVYGIILNYEKFNIKQI